MSDITNEQVGLLILNEIVKRLEIIEEKIEEIADKPTEAETPQTVYTLLEMMELLQIGKSKAYELLKTGEIKSFKVGWEYRIPRSAIDEYTKGAV